jgi:hypothetical protein
MSSNSPSTALGENSGEGDTPGAAPVLAFRREQAVAKRRLEPPLLLHALAIVRGVAEQYVFAQAWIVDEQALAAAIEFKGRLLQGRFGKNRDGIGSKRASGPQQCQSFGVRDGPRGIGTMATLCTSFSCNSVRGGDGQMKRSGCLSPSVGFPATMNGDASPV